MRILLAIILGLCVPTVHAQEPPTVQAEAQRVKIRFKIKTKSGGIVGNVLIEGKDLFNCISKLMARYPGCEILEAKEQ